MNESEKPIEVREQIARLTIETEMEEGGEDWRRHLNNIHTLFDHTFREAMLDAGMLDEKPSSNLALSELHRNQTWNEFFETLERTLGEFNLGAERDRILAEMATLDEQNSFVDPESGKLTEMRKKIPGEEKARLVWEFKEKLIPVYIRLRAMGYNKMDLTSAGSGPKNLE